MKPAFFVGVALIVLGVVALVYQGITYTKHNTTVIGPIEVRTQHEKTLPLPPVLGAIALVGGVLLVMTGSRK